MYYESDKSLHTPRTCEKATAILQSLRKNIQSIIHGIQTQEGISGLDHQQEKLQKALNRFWSEVDAGRLHVESTALLRAMCSITCSNLPKYLSDSNADCTQVIRNLRLFLNTVEYIIRPTW